MKTLFEKLKLSIIPLFLGIFTFFGFGTAELYITNKDEFWFLYTDIFSRLLFFSIITFFILILILLLIPNIVFKYVLAAIYGVVIVMYLQGNFLPNNYGQLDGTEIDWSSYHGRFLINTFIWAVFILGFVFLYLKFKEKALFIYKTIAGVILATQIVTLVVLCISVPQKEADIEAVLSKDGEFQLSDTDNTIVFVLDCFDSELFCELLEKYPEKIKSDWEDFTFYHDMVGGATRTMYAIPYILTGYPKSDDGSYADYLKSSANRSDLLLELQKDNYDARLYTQSEYIDMNQTKSIDNIKNSKAIPSSKLQLTKEYLKLTAFRYMPHAFKKYFWLYGDDFNSFKSSVGDIEPYVIEDVEFYNDLISEDIECIHDKDVFRFYHLQGAHEPYTMNQNCERIKVGTGTEEDQAIGSLKIVYTFIQKMKSNGIYDDSNIIVMADHGSRGLEQNPLFMIKQSDEHHEFAQSDVPMSYKDLSSIFTDLIKNNHSDIEQKYANYGERYFYKENGNDKIDEYVTFSKADNEKEFELTGNTYSSNYSNASYQYHIGEVLSFAKEATANGYCISGFSKNEGTHTWTLGTTSEMYFEINDEYDNLLVELECGVIHVPQNVIFYANGNEVGQLVFDKDNNKKTILIPHKYVADGKLELKMEYLDAVSPKDLGESVDERILSLSLKSMVISSVEE